MHPADRTTARGTQTRASRSYEITLWPASSAAPGASQVAERVGFEPTRGVNP